MRINRLEMKTTVDDNIIRESVDKNENSIILSK